MFCSQISVQNTIKESTGALANNSTRAEVYDFVVANPGIQFRGISAGLSIAIGTAEFHLGVLKKAGLISFFIDGKYKRYFASKRFSVREMKLISLLRHDTTRELIKKITSEKTIPHSRLASHLSITSQGLTWQINQLTKVGIVKKNIDGIKVDYSLNEEYIQLLPGLICVVEQ
jgi:predicted transcriptional regulator